MNQMIFNKDVELEHSLNDLRDDIRYVLLLVDELKTESMSDGNQTDYSYEYLNNMSSQLKFTLEQL